MSLLISRYRVVVFLVFSVLIQGCGQPPEEKTIDEMYPLPWVERINVDIAKTLVANNIRGCGQYKERKAATSSSEFLISCTRDGKTWKYYLVFTASGDVTGPLSDKIE